MHKKSWLFLFLILPFFWGCGKGNYNPDIKPAQVQIDIDPGSTLYQKLNTVGGCIYVKNGDPGVYLSSESRGVIIYRVGISDFKAYDRIPPNNPNQCGSTTQLVVGDNFPFAKDPCTGNEYNLLDGTLYSGSGTYPMISYQTQYDGQLLHVYN
ncbi:MAG: hypothetical protein JXR71_12250 [Bacteroidales bacterium]|nr:hypothetical protein [Bacteroidales bacterium]